MGAWSELEARDRVVSAFMDYDSLYIALHRPVWDISAAGGRVQDGQDTLAPQQFYVYPFKRRLTVEFKYNPQTYGEERVEDITWILIFNRDKNIQPLDYFDAETDINPSTDRLLHGRYEVTFISARLWDRGQAGIRYRG
jgi:hypothetical protein